jgi:hypothetical protein
MSFAYCKIILRLFKEAVSTEDISTAQIEPWTPHFEV